MEKEEAEIVGEVLLITGLIENLKGSISFLISTEEYYLFTNRPVPDEFPSSVVQPLKSYAKQSPNQMSVPILRRKRRSKSFTDEKKKVKNPCFSA